MSDVPALVKRMEMRPTLTNCERVIDQALYAYAAAGDALRTIRDDRLYKESHKSFESYCRERWGWSRTQADRQIAAAGVHDALYERSELAPMGVTFEPPRNERTARELVPLRKDPDRLAEVWAKVVEQHGPDAEAKHVRKVVAEVLPKPTPAPVSEPSRSTDDAVHALRRLMGAGYDVRTIRAAVDLIDPEGARR